MSRLQTANVDDATGELAVLYSAIKRAVGKVPNAFATLGSNSPAILAHVLQTGAVLESKGSLSRRELEAINLAVSENTGCDYCVSNAPSVLGFVASRQKSSQFFNSIVDVISATPLNLVVIILLLSILLPRLHIF